MPKSGNSSAGTTAAAKGAAAVCRVLAAGVFCAVWLCVSLPVYAERQQSLSEKAPQFASLIERLSLQEKAAQILMVNIDGSKQVDVHAFSRFGGAIPGAVLLFGYNVADTPQAFSSFLCSCTAAAKTAARKDCFIPPLYALDNEGGLVYRTRRFTVPLPSAEVIGKQYRIDQTADLYRKMAEQMRLLGLHVNLAPVAEVETPENKLVLATRCYGTEKSSVGRYAAAAVRGMQKAGILAAVKHFPGNGSGDLHDGAAVLDIDYRQLTDEYALPFADAVKAGAAIVLVSHVTVPKIEAVPFCFSKKGRL